MDALLPALISQISHCVYKFAILVHNLLLGTVRQQQKQPELSVKAEQILLLQQHPAEKEDILLERELQMKKVRFSDEEDNCQDKEVVSFAGYENNNMSNQLTNGNEANGESTEGLKVKLQKQQDLLYVLNNNLKRLDEGGQGVTYSSLALEQAQHRIDGLEKENQQKETTIDDLRRGLSNALEKVSNSLTNGYSEKEEAYLQKIASFQAEISKLEQKLSNATEEKEYYKKHYNSNHDNHSSYSALNGSISDRDDFGKELMLANKRKYHLESKVRQLEHDLKEAHNTVQHLERSLQSSEKYLWLEKEKSAVLEQERKGLNDELDWLRRDNDYLKRQIEALNQEKNNGLESPSGETPSSPTTPIQRDILSSGVERMHKDYEAKISDILQMKNQLEWRLGEQTKNWNDAKWKVGELESALAHKNYELDQSSNRIKQLESVLATPVTNMSEEINWLKEEVRKVGEEKSKADWRLGEVTQYWNDAKWRIGELEGEISRVKHALEEACCRNTELEKGHLDWRLTQLNKAYNDAQWRVGELEAELDRKCEHIQHMEASEHTNFEQERSSLQSQLEQLREQKSKVEWRLGEVMQHWNDSKWRINELEGSVKQKEIQLREMACKMEQMVESRTQCNATISERVLTQLSNGSFIINKQPNGERQCCNMVTCDNLVSQNADLRRVWLEVDAEGAQEIFVIGSFVNWECALLCTPVPGESTRRGLWVDLPPGTHQFRFIRDGTWFTATTYSQSYNEYGGTNNSVTVH